MIVKEHECDDDSSLESLIATIIKSYISLRALNELEREATALLYPLVLTMWFTDILHRPNSLKSILQLGNELEITYRLNHMKDVLTQDYHSLFE